MAFALVPRAQAQDTFAATFSSATDVGYTAPFYEPGRSGARIFITLNYAPTPGTTLTVVNVTGPKLIQGSAANLPHRQRLALTYNGETYNFVANYYGGDGNDLVLEWADTRLVAWGDNGSGQLGNGSTRESFGPVAVTATGALAGKNVIAMATGYRHSLVLCSDGTVATWGQNSSGQLGNNSIIASTVPVDITHSGVLADKTVIAVAAGAYHSLVLCSDGTVAAWGDNTTGQLGSGSAATTSLVPVSTATDVIGTPGARKVIAIAAGYSHNLALCYDGTLATWGFNSKGQLGNGTYNTLYVPGTVPINARPEAITSNGVLNGKTVRSIVAGGANSMALCTDGTLATWGYAVNDQYSPDETGSLLPVAFDTSVGALAGKTLKALTSGGSHHLALCTDGTLASWGYGSHGQLGNYGASQVAGYLLNAVSPVNITSNGMLASRPVIGIAAGSDHSLALCSDGTLAAWGDNRTGQLGNNSVIDNRAPGAVTAVSLAPGERFMAMAPGTSSFFCLALIAQAPPSQRNAQLASLAPSIGSLSPVFASDTTSYLITVPAGIAAIQFTPTTADSGATVKVNGVATASGSLSAGISLSFGDTVIPMVVTARDGGTTRTYTVTVRRALLANTLGASFGDATDVPLTAAGFVATGNGVLFSLNYAPVIGTSLTIVKNTGPGFIQGTFLNLVQGQAVALAFGGKTYDFLANYYGGSSGRDLVLQWRHVRLVAWGDNRQGAVGDNTTVDRLTPVPVSISTALRQKNVISVSMGNLHSLALCSDGTVAAWGYNIWGQLGNGTAKAYAMQPEAVKMTGVLAGKRVVAVAAGGSHNLALCSDGTLAAWGGNSSGQLGNNSTTDCFAPVAVVTTGVLAGKKVVAVAAGLSNSLALCSDGTLAAWGGNSSGELGDNSNMDSLVPVAVTTSGALAGKTVTAIAAGLRHCLVLCSDGTMAAWGDNFRGSLGYNLAARSFAPVVVPPVGALAGRTVVAVAAGGNHSLALCSDGTVAAWGDNSSGELGDMGNTSNDGMPVAASTSHVLPDGALISIAVGGFHSLAVASDGRLYAWGDNDFGQLGNNSHMNNRLMQPVLDPSLISGDRYVFAASGGSSTHSLALVATANPRIEVSGNGFEILPGDATPSVADGTDFGSVALLGAQATQTFIINNRGGGSLDTSALPVISGEAAGDFLVTLRQDAAIAPDGSSPFAITFDPSLPGQRTATVIVASNDPLTPSYSFNITGFGQQAKKLAQTITFTPPAVFYVGQPPYTLSATSSSGLPVTFSVLSSNVEGNVLNPVSPGIVKIQAFNNGSSVYNAAPPVTRTITVKAKPTVLTLVNLSQTYNGQPRPVLALGSTEPFAITYRVGATYVPAAPTAAGSYLVKAVAGKKTVTGTLIIAKAPLEVLPDDRHKFTGMGNPSLTFKYSGFINGETAAVVTKAPVLKTTATVASIAGTYPITASGAVAANYTFIYRQGLMVVDSFAGAYEVLLENDVHLPVGKLTITAAAASTSFTARLVTSADLAAPSFTGKYDLLSSPASGVWALGTATTNVVVNRVAIPYVINFSLSPYGRATASATRAGAPLGTSTTGQKISTKPVLYAGAHTAVLEPATPAGATVPAGAGWATVKAGTTGILTFAGKLGDGAAFTTTLNPGTPAPNEAADPGYRLFVQPYLVARKDSCLGGEFTLAPHPTLANRRYLAQRSMTWKKTGLPADASYRAGFGPVNTVLMMDPWVPVDPARYPKGLSLKKALKLNDWLGFYVRHSPTGSASQADLPLGANLYSDHTVHISGGNLTKWKVNPFGYATGTFTGSFELTDGKLKRPVAFNGVLRQTIDTTDPLIGDGQYLLPPVTGTEKSTGEIMFSRTQPVIPAP